MANITEPVEDADIVVIKEASSEDNRLAIAQNMSTEESHEAKNNLKYKLDVRLLACM